MIIAVSLVLLVIVALGGYFFVYPRLRDAEVEPVATQTSTDPSPGTAIPDLAAPSDSSVSTTAESEASSPSSQPTPDREPERPAEVPAAEVGQTPVSQRRPEPSDGARRWPSRTRANEPGPDVAPAISNPEPVASSPVAGSEQAQATTPPEPVPAEPGAEPSDSNPALSAQETQTAQATVDRQPRAEEKPAYQGPRRGVIIWTGDVDKGTTVVIDGASASIGQVQGALPGVACMVRLTAQNVAVTEGPGPRNGYRRISLRFNKKGRFSIPVEWEVLH